jgi:phosphoglycolate phosphatase
LSTAIEKGKRVMARCWVFDLDGTIVDSHANYFKSLAQVFADFGIDLTENDKAEVLRIAVRDRLEFLKQRLGTEVASKALEKLEAHLIEDHLRTDSFDGIQELLNSLKNRGFILAVWTAREKISALRVLKHIGLDDYFAVCMSGSCVSECKPNPDGLVRIAKELGLQTTDLIMVGDHDNDMLAAKACQALAIRAYWHQPHLPQACKLADFRFNQVSALNIWAQSHGLT